MVLDVEELDPARLTDLLADSELTGGATVLGVSSRPVGAGQVASCVELSLELEGRTSPVTLVAKGPSDDPVSLATAGALHLYEREVRFYRAVASTVSIRTPSCLHAAFDPETSKFLLLLESLSPAAPVDQFEGLSMARTELALRELAGLHAPHWATTAITTSTFIAGGNDTGTADFLLVLPALFDTFLEQYGDRLSAATRAVVEWLQPSRLALYLEGRGGPLTVSHSDFRTDNLLFEGRDGEVPMATVDWQTVAMGAASLDVAYFLTTSLDTETRRKKEDELLAAYHDRLCALGVTGYDARQLHDDYAWHTFQGVVMLVCSAVIVERTERGDAMFLTMIERCAAAVDDLDARRRLEA